VRGGDGLGEVDHLVLRGSVGTAKAGEEAFFGFGLLRPLAEKLRDGSALLNRAARAGEVDQRRLVDATIVGAGPNARPVDIRKTPMEIGNVDPVVVFAVVTDGFV